MQRLLYCIQVSQLQHVVSVKDALLQVYSHADDELDSPSTYVRSLLSSCNFSIQKTQQGVPEFRKWVTNSRPGG